MQARPSQPFTRKRRAEVLSFFALLLPTASAKVEIGFCDGNGDGFYTEQPEDHVERWTRPVDNGTHLVVHWSSSFWACKYNVTEYKVNVITSSPILNKAVNLFGSMPQDICAADSVARSKLTVDGAANDKHVQTTCKPYSNCASTPNTESAVAIPMALRMLSKLDVTVSVIAYGKLASKRQPGEPIRGERPAVMWCHTYRQAPRADAAASDAPRDDKATSSWRRFWAGVWKRGETRGATGGAQPDEPPPSCWLGSWWCGTATS